MAVNKEKKSFKKFAKKHLAGVIETRRKTAKAKKEKTERLERKKVREAKKAYKEEREHVDQLEQLKEKDPNFFSYLEDEDPTLLQFGTDDINLVDEDEGSDAETEEDESAGDEDRCKDSAAKTKTEERSSTQVKKSRAEAEEGTLGAQKAHQTDAKGTCATQEQMRATADDDSGSSGDDGDREDEGTGSAAAQRISAAEVSATVSKGGAGVEGCVDLFVTAARELGFPVKEKPKPRTTRKFDDPHMVKDALLRTAQAAGSNVSALVTSKGGFRSHKTRYLVKRMLVALTTVIAETASDAVLAAGLLHAVTPFVPLMHFVKGATKAVLRAGLNMCTAAEETVRVAAYVLVRAIATRATGTRSMYQSAAFKGIFLALIRTAHQYTVHNQSAIAFLINCVVDLYGTDMEAAYQHTYVYLRQLAVYLRAALQQQSVSNVRAVVNWQYLVALRTWGAVVSTYAEPTELGPLIHPVVQIATGLMDLFSSPRMFPMHLQVVEVLNHIAARTDGMYISVSPYLLRILTSPSMALTRAAAHRPAADEPVELPFTIRVKKSQARSPLYHRAVWNETLYLLAEHVATHSGSIGFPEAFWAVESTLKKLRSEVKVPQVHAEISSLIRCMQSVAQQVSSARDNVRFGPCDLASVKQFEEEQKARGNQLRVHHMKLRKQRVDQFISRQKELREGRVTLESVVAQRTGPAAARAKRARHEG